MPEPKEVVIVYGDFWVGCYIDGKLLDQGYSLSVFIECLMEALGVNFKEVVCDEMWLRNVGKFPESLSEIKK